MDFSTSSCAIFMLPGVRELVVQTQSTDAVHEGDRLTPHQLNAIYQIDESLCGPGDPKYIGVVDDMLTAGAHFRAMKDTLQARFPQPRSPASL